MKDKVIELIGVEKIYTMGESKVHALKDVYLDVERGEFLALMGPSGSGKSTLMNIIGLLDRPDGGTYLMENVEVNKLDDDHRSDLRNKTIGFIFQNFNLIPRASAVRNVMLPLTYRSLSNTERTTLSETALEQVGLKERMQHKPNQMSGGERQRVAIARALVGGPSVILADEPTGNLDTATGEEIIRILTDLSEKGQTVIMVTHDPLLAQRAHRIIHMRDGALID